MGINLGDILIENGNLFGHGVNVAVWLEGVAEPGGIMVSHTVHDHVQGKLSFRFDDLGERAVKEVGRPIRMFRVGWEGGPAGRPAGPPESLAVPDKPSIAVLPFTNMSSDPEQQYFSDGLTEDIITALSRSSGLWVIARASTFTYKDTPTDVKRIARELGVRYVMEGSVRRAGARLRVTAQLIDAMTGHHLWAERYDRSPTSSKSRTRSRAASPPRPRRKSNSPKLDPPDRGHRRTSRRGIWPRAHSPECTIRPSRRWPTRRISSKRRSGSIRRTRWRTGCEAWSSSIAYGGERFRTTLRAWTKPCSWPERPCDSHHGTSTHIISWPWLTPRPGSSRTPSRNAKAAWR
jgi:TolB-like protein